MSGKTISTSDTKIEALQLQSSAYGVAIPVVGGVTRIAGNLIYQTDFKAVPTTTSQGGKGGGVKTQNTTYSYTTALLMGLCHGQISAIPRIWVGKKKYADDAGVTTLTNVSENFTIPVGGGTATVAHAAAFSSNGYVQCFTVGGDGESTLTQYAEGVDYTIKNGVYTFVSGGVTVTINYTYAATGAGGTALSKLGITLVPGTLTQSAPSWVTSRHPSDALPYAGLAYVSADAYSLGSGAQVENHNFEVVGPGAYSVTSSSPDIDPSMFTLRVLQDSRYGARFPATFFDASQQWSKYCVANGLLMSPALTAQVKAADFFSQMAMLTNTGIVWSGGRVSMVPYGDTGATGNGVTYTPNVTPIYDLTDDAYITQPGEAPVRVHRKKQSDAYNHIRVQFSNRANDYATEVAEAKDQADIDTNGLRSAAIVNADWICDAAVARNVAQLMLQRSVYVRATYEFSLPWNFCYLEPMDLVTLTDAGMGLSKTPVRIVSIEEADGQLNFQAEEFALGVANAALYGTQVGAGFWQDFNAAPGSANAPTIFEAPLAMSPSGLSVYVAATGTGTAWGGCRVWASMDGTNYREVGKISGGSRYGTLTSAVSSSVGVLLNAGILTSGSASDSSAYSTLCFIGGANPEYFAFQTATLTSALHYTLGGLTRGAYSTPSGNAHASGDAFVRVDESVVNSGPLALSMIGQTISIKLTSFNIFGLNEESLANVTAYSYTISGYMMKLAPTAPSGLTYTTEPSGVRFICAKNPEPTVVGYEWRIGSTWASATVLDKLGGTSTLWSTPTAGSYTVWVAAVDNLGNESTPTSLGVTLSNAGPMMYGTAALYQWSTAVPANPSGSSTYAWSNGASSAYTGAGGWSVTVPANPGTPGIQLWRAIQQVSAVTGTTTSSVSWASGYSVQSVGANGVNGTQAATPTVYQWAASIPAAPSGAATYTWASSSFGAAPTGWALTPGTSPSAGFTLWAAKVTLVDSSAATTTGFNWTSAGITAIGYAGSNGSNGGTGQQGASSRMCYSRIAGNPSPTSNTLAMAGDTLPSASASNLQWGLNVSWTATDPSPTSTNTLYQADGLYNPATNQTVWSTPYISSLKVGSLSSITSNTGSLVVTGSIQSGTALQSGTTMTGAGLIVGNGGQFSVGNAATNITYDGTVMTLNGNVVATGNLNSGAVTNSYAGSSTGTALSVAITVPTGATSLIVVAYAGDPFISGGTGEAASGAVIIPQGQLWVNGVNVTVQQGTVVYATGSPTVGSYNVTLNRNAASQSGTMYLSVLVGKR